jgi:hypothetical protein
VGTRAKTVLFLTALLVFTGLGTSWWNDSWEHRKKITIEENSGEKLKKYELELSMNTSTPISDGQMANDCSDIRFANSEDKRIDHWIKQSTCDQENTEIWVEIPHIQADGSKKIYMYYGNDNAESKSNGSATFKLFDDFSDGDMDKWKTERYTNNRHNYNWRVTSSKSVRGGYALEHSTNDYRLRPTVDFNFSDNLKAEYYVLRKSSCCQGISLRLDDSDSNSYADYDFRYNYAGNMWRVRTNIDSYSDKNAGHNSGTWYKVETEFDNEENYAQGSMQGLSAGEASTEVNPDDIYFNPYIYSSGEAMLDWVIFRSYADPKPSYTIGEAEEGGLPICDKRGPLNECISENSHDIDSQNIDVNSRFEAKETSIFEAFTNQAQLSITNSSIFSGLWKGTFNLTADDITIKTGAEFRPSNGRIILSEN